MVRLGQNFLADPNLLDAIVRDAALDAGRRRARGRGGGRGADRAARRGGQPASTRSRSTAAWRGRWRRSPRRPNVELHWADAMKLDLAGARPGADRGGRQPALRGRDAGAAAHDRALPTVRSWTVMVQREIADRLRAGPGSRTYGSPSVLVQLACEVSLLRTVDPAVFRPRPRVASAILCLRRTGPAADPATRDLVRSAFAHRRKSLARSLEHGRPGSLVAARAALAELGLPEDARAESLSPEDFAALSAKLSAN